MFLSRAARARRTAAAAKGEQPETYRLVDEETFFNEIGYQPEEVIRGNKSG